ncbi:MAG: preprotein translocase subunit SecG [Firmicutes bacterium]|nr:preprotein translocase subunit SecG [Bacillota bacterium]MDD7601893.1 preprotein translocase subunit SecG [Bacillota bacterium]MDY5855909.1 preprotein translocase subunit SecG [Anaerovoracaceae bacterium]
MKTFLMVLLAIASIILIASVLLQSGNSAGLSGSIAGGAEQLFGKKKSKGYEAILAKVTAIGAVLFIVLSLVIVTIFN